MYRVVCLVLFCFGFFFLFLRERDVAQCVERPLEVRWVVGLIPLGGPIKLFLVPASAPQLV